MDFLNSIGDSVKSIGEQIIGILPHSPIVYLQTVPEVEEILGMVNWFIPIYTMIGMTEAWLTAIAVYYILQAILRWVKIIE